MKSDSYQDFTWLEVQNALKGIVELKKTERSVASVTAKIATETMVIARLNLTKSQKRWRASQWTLRKRLSIWRLKL